MGQRITRKDMERLAGWITENAIILGLIPEGSLVIVYPGSEGYAPAVSVMNPERTGHLPVSWLPDFGYRDTIRDAHRALLATNKVLTILARRTQQ